MKEEKKKPLVRTRIEVPFGREYEVEDLGAEFDKRMNSYYVPDNLPIIKFQEFIPLPIELVPSSNWEKNVRSEFKEEWADIRRVCYRKANYRCERCGGVGEQHPVECHEVWSYDSEHRIQKLERLIALCPMCHKSQHYGFAVISGMENEVREHLLKINQWKKRDLDKYLNEVFLLFELRSKQKWTLNLENLQYYR